MAVAVPANDVQLVTQFESPFELSGVADDFDAMTAALVQLHSLSNAVMFTQLTYVSAMIAQQQEFYDDETTENGAYRVAEVLHLECGLSFPAAKTMTRVAIACRSLPVLTQAFADGVFGWEYLCLLTRIATPENEREYVENIGMYSIRRLRELVARAEAKPKDHESAHERRSLRLSSNETTGFLRGEWPLPMFATIRDAVDRLADNEGKDLATDTWRRQDERRADALARIAGGSIAADPDQDRATVSIHVDLMDIARDEATVTIDEFVVPVGAIRERLCDTRYQLIWERNGKPLGIGRMSRDVPHWLKRLLDRRDMGCRFPGCQNTKGVEAHHIHWWRFFGETDIDNLVNLCQRHHHVIHDKGWQIRGNPNGVLEFVRPDGSIYTTSPSGAPQITGIIEGLLRDDEPTRHRGRAEQLRMELLQDPDPPPSIVDLFPHRRSDNGA